METLKLVVSEDLAAVGRAQGLNEADLLRDIGGKARNLALLTATPGILVPRWCCAPASHFDRLRDAMPQALQDLWAKTLGDSAAGVPPRGQDITTEHRQALDELSHQSKSWLESASLPEDLTADISAWLQASFAKNPQATFAVRSSAVGEDSGSHSFAGQFESVLYVQESDIMAAVKHCYASAFGTRVLAYLAHAGLSPKSLRMAVLVQEMWPSTRSGVLFTCNPKGRLEEMVAVAGYGVGEGVVSDRVETDEIILTRASPTSRTWSPKPSKTTPCPLRYTVREKLGMMVRDPSAGPGAQLVDVPEDMRNKHALSDDNIEELARAALAIESMAGSPQDIEWGFDDANQLAILQTRPITTLPRGAFYLCDNSNVSESYPGVSLPLTYDIVRQLYATIFESFIRSTGAHIDQEARTQTFDHLVVHVQGRIYYNLSNWYTMLRMVKGTEPFIGVWEEMLGITPSKKLNDPNSRQSLWQVSAAQAKNLGTYTRILASYITLDHKMKRLHERFQAISENFWATPLENLSLRELVVLLHDATARICRGWEVTLWNDAFTFSLTSLTRLALQKIAGCSKDDAARLLTDLLSGDAHDDSLTMESALSIASTTDIARQLEKNPDLMKTLAQKGLSAWSVSTGTLEDPAARAFGQNFERHLHRFGDRTMNELKLETRTFRQNPEELLQLILRYANDPTSCLAASGDTHRHDHAWQQVVACLDQTMNQEPKGPKSMAPAAAKVSRSARIHLLRRLVHAARTCMRHRENSRFDRSRAYGIARAITTEIGTRLVAEGILEKATDVYHLRLVEIERLAQRGHDTKELWHEVLLQRKALAAQWQQDAPDGRFWIVGHEPAGQWIPQESMDDQASATEDDDRDAILKGTGTSPGQVEAEAIVLEQPSVDCDVKGKILVTRMTDPGWVFLMVNCAGLVSEKGSILSHTAIIGRELGIPTVVGVPQATRRIVSGSKIVVDGATGRVFLTTAQKGQQPS
jgi:phosphoenolpyruvate synthase/pyruvate phosphate dikinase